MPPRKRSKQSCLGAEPAAKVSKVLRRATAAENKATSAQGAPRKDEPFAEHPETIVKKRARDPQAIEEENLNKKGLLTEKMNARKDCKVSQEPCGLPLHGEEESLIEFALRTTEIRMALANAMVGGPIPQPPKNQLGNSYTSLPPPSSDIMDSLFRAESLLDRQLYMPIQPDISEKMRMTLIDWLVSVHLKFECRPETLFLAVDVVDRYLAAGNRTLRSMLQLVGVTSMLLAAKYEEIWPPEVNECVSISANTYPREEILKMEREILRALGFKLTVPNVMHFLSWLLDVSEADTVSCNLAYYFAETSLLHYELLTCKPSIVAAACMVLARVTQHAAEPLTPTLCHYARCSLAEASDVAKRLLEFTHTVTARSKYTAIFHKYSGRNLNEVSELPLPNPDQLLEWFL